jgi:hypothetical protein
MALGTGDFLRQWLSDLEHDGAVGSRAPAKKLVTLNKLAQSESVQPAQQAMVAMVMVY